MSGPLAGPNSKLTLTKGDAKGIKKAETSALVNNIYSDSVVTTTIQVHLKISRSKCT